MRSVSASLLAALLTVAVIAGAATAHANKTVLVLGDSLSAAHGIDPAKGWVRLLSHYLAKADPDYRVVNASISGETTGGGLNRLSGLLARHDPTIVIIELGANDGLRGQPLAAIQRNLEQLVRQCLAADARVLLVGMYIPPNYGRSYAERFHALFQQVASDNDVGWVPFLLQGVATDPALMQRDGLHPKATAQPRILQNVLAHLKPLLGS